MPLLGSDDPYFKLSYYKTSKLANTKRPKHRYQFFVIKWLARLLKVTKGAHTLAQLPRTVLELDCPPSPLPRWPALTLLQSNQA